MEANRSGEGPLGNGTRPERNDTRPPCNNSTRPRRNETFPQGPGHNGTEHRGDGGRQGGRGGRGLLVSAAVGAVAC